MGVLPFTFPNRQLLPIGLRVLLRAELGLLHNTDLRSLDTYRRSLLGLLLVVT